MRIEMEFEGLEELVKAFEKAASDDAIRATNKKIVERAQPVVKRIMSGKVPSLRTYQRADGGSAQSRAYRLTQPTVCQSGKSQ